MAFRISLSPANPLARRASLGRSTLPRAEVSAHVETGIPRGEVPQAQPQNRSDRVWQGNRCIAAFLRHEGLVLVANRLYLASQGCCLGRDGRGADGSRRKARQAADTARKAVAHSMYWTFLALLIGAFCASFAATIGGRERDRVPVV